MKNIFASINEKETKLRQLWYMYDLMRGCINIINCRSNIKFFFCHKKKPLSTYLKIMKTNINKYTQDSMNRCNKN